MIKILVIFLSSLLSNISFAEEIIIDDKLNLPEGYEVPIIDYGTFIDNTINNDDSYLFLIDNISQTKFIIKPENESNKIGEIFDKCNIQSEFSYVIIENIKKGFTLEKLIDLTNLAIEEEPNLTKSEILEIQNVVNFTWRSKLSNIEQMKKTFEFCMDLNGYNKLE